MRRVTKKGQIRVARAKTAWCIPRRRKVLRDCMFWEYSCPQSHLLILRIGSITPATVVTEKSHTFRIGAALGPQICPYRTIGVQERYLGVMTCVSDGCPVAFRTGSVVAVFVTRVAGARGKNEQVSAYSTVWAGACGNYFIWTLMPRGLPAGSQSSIGSATKRPDREGSVTKADCDGVVGTFRVLSASVVLRRLPQWFLEGTGP